MFLGRVVNENIATCYEKLLWQQIDRSIFIRISHWIPFILDDNNKISVIIYSRFRNKSRCRFWSTTARSLKTFNVFFSCRRNVSCYFIDWNCRSNFFNLAKNVRRSVAETTYATQYAPYPRASTRWKIVNRKKTHTHMCDVS